MFQGTYLYTFNSFGDLVFHVIDKVSLIAIKQL